MVGNSDKLPWAVVSIGGQTFAVSVSYVQEMLIAPHAEMVPGAAAWVRGVLNLRGQVMPLLDLHKRLGLISRAEELDDFCRLMVEREQDHRNWLAELEASVRERRAFGLTTDPHKCKFGKWYDAYEAPNLVVKQLLTRFDAPHKAIHAVGDRVTALMADDNASAAQALIEETRGGVLHQMIALFGELRETARDSQREIALIVKDQVRRCGLCVDSVDSVEPLATGSISDLPTSAISRESTVLARKVGRRSRNGDLVLILETQALLDSLEPLPS